MVSEVIVNPVTVANELRPVLLRLARELRRETEQLGITSRQATLLWLIRSHPGLSLRELAAEEGISAPALSGHVDRLEKAGLIERVRDEKDRRRVGLTLTEQGEGLLRRVRARRTTWLTDRLRGTRRRRRRCDRGRDRPAGETAVTAALLALNARTFASLRRHRNYRLFFTGQVISVSGSWMQNVALAWLVVELTHSPLAVGMLAFCRFIPFTVFGLAAGVVADRIDNRKLVITTQVVSMTFATILAALVLTGTATLWLVYLLAILSSTALVFDAPGRHALTFQMVGRAELPNAVALNASLFNASRVVGPAVAGVLIAAFGVGVCFALNAVTFLAVLAGLLLMRPEELFPLVRGPEPPTLMRGVREGFAWVRASREARLVLTIVAVVSTVGFNFHVILPLLASDTLDAGPEVFGILSGCFGAGALVGALLSAGLGRASWKVLLAGVTGFSLSLLVLAPLATVWACAVLLFVTGTCFTLWTSNANSILQLQAPDHLRGRVVSLYLWAFAGLAPLGGLFAGWLCDIGGTQLSFAVAGLTGLVTAMFAASAVLHRPNMQSTTS